MYTLDSIKNADLSCVLIVCDYCENFHTPALVDTSSYRVAFKAIVLKISTFQQSKITLK